MASEYRMLKLHDLHMGDIVLLNVPFEENTRDYYNGYKPLEIRDKPFQNRLGQTSKIRPVVYIGHDRNTISYLGITSHASACCDSLHQYKLKNKSFMREGDTRQAYVELGSLRAMNVSYKRELSVPGKLEQEELDNILHRVSHDTLQFTSKRDHRGYVPKDMQEAFQAELAHQGYELETKEPYSTTYKKKETGETVTCTKYGMMHYHFPMSKEEVREMVSRREGRPITPPPETKETDFKTTIDQLSAKMKTQERKAGKYVNSC